VVRTTTAVVSLFVMALSSAAASAQAPAAEPDLEHPQNTNAGIFAFTGRCAGCHDNATNGAANRAELVKHTPEAVLASITSGRMAQYATGLSEFDKRALAVYVGGRPFGAAAAGDASQMENRCTTHPAFEPFKGSEWNGWGFDNGDTRFPNGAGNDCRGRSQTRPQVGLRLSIRQFGVRPAVDCRRTRFRRRRYRIRVRDR
jgi:cytochrome c553